MGKLCTRGVPTPGQSCSSAVLEKKPQCRIQQGPEAGMNVLKTVLLCLTFLRYIKILLKDFQLFSRHKAKFRVTDARKGRETWRGTCFAPEVTAQRSRSPSRQPGRLWDCLQRSRSSARPKQLLPARADNAAPGTASPERAS